MIFVFIIGLLTAIFWPNCSNRVFWESFFGLGFLNLIIVWRMVKVHPSVALMFLYCSLSSVFVMAFPNIYSKPLPELYDMKISAVMMQAYICLLLWSIMPFLLNTDFFKATLGGLLIAAVTDSFWMVFRWIFFGRSQCYALLSNSAMDASFIACMLPLVFYGIREKLYKISIPVLLLMLTAIIGTKSSTGYAAVGVALASFLLIHYGKKALLIIAPLSIVISGLSYLLLKGELLNPNGRYSIWTMSMKFFWNETNPWFGAGLGSYFFWGPQIQMHEQQISGPMPQHMDIFLWMHNDWAQLVFELGFVGLGIFVLMVLFMGEKAWAKKNSLFPIIITYAFIAITQMPFRIFVFQTLGVALIMLCFNEENKREDILSNAYDMSVILAKGTKEVIKDILKPLPKDQDGPAT